MDFCDVDDPKSQTLFTQIQQVRQWNGWGLNKLYRIFSDAVGAVFRILGAAALSVSLFILPVPAGRRRRRRPPWAPGPIWQWRNGGRRRFRRSFPPSLRLQ